jgi:hypothetical protein
MLHVFSSVSSVSSVVERFNLQTCAKGLRHRA